MTKSLDRLNRLQATPQSFEKTPASTNSTVVTQPTQNGGRLAVAAVPLLVLVASCLLPLASRTFGNSLSNVTNFAVRGETRQAKAVASHLLSQLTEQRVSETDLRFSEMTAFSVRHNDAIKEWNVSHDGQGPQHYSLRINAATGCVYAINRLPKDEANLELISAPSQHSVSAEQAKALALRYLKISGVEPRTVTLVPDVSDVRCSEKDSASYCYEPRDYTLSYRRHVPGIGNRLLKVAVSRATGELEYYWNPSAAM